jgi:hypothetical protein
MRLTTLLFINSIMYGLFARTTAEGSKNYTRASLSNDIPPGGYISSCEVTQSVNYAHHHIIIAPITLQNCLSSGPLSDECPLFRPGGVVASKDSDRIRLQLWKEAATVLIKEAPQTEDLWSV